MSLLLDTNVVSELRKGSRANPHVVAWFVLVTRNVKHVAWTGVSYLNPFDPAGVR